MNYAEDKILEICQDYGITDITYEDINMDSKLIRILGIEEPKAKEILEEIDTGYKICYLVGSFGTKNYYLDRHGKLKEQVVSNVVGHVMKGLIETQSRKHLHQG